MSESGKRRSEEELDSVVLDLQEHSRARKVCFCLGTNTDVARAFCPWEDNREGTSECNKYHAICKGGYLILSTPNPPKALQPSKCQKNQPHSLGYRTTKYKRGQERSIERDFAAFQHLNSYTDYAQHYRMSKSCHTMSVVSTTSERQQKYSVPTKNFWTIKYDERYMEHCYKPTLADSFKINPCLAPCSLYINPHQLPFNYRETTTSATSIPELDSFYITRESSLQSSEEESVKVDAEKLWMAAGQNPVSPLQNSEECAKLDAEKTWMPNNAVFTSRNSSAYMHHSRGYFSSYNRPNYSQQASRYFPALGRRVNTCYTADSRARHYYPIGDPRKLDGTGQQQEQIGLNQHNLSQQCTDTSHGRLYSGNVMLGSYLPNDLKSLEIATTRSPLQKMISKATIYNCTSANAKQQLSTSGTTCRDGSGQVRLPKLRDKLADRNVMQIGSEWIHFPDIGNEQGVNMSQTQMKDCSSNTQHIIKFLHQASGEKEHSNSDTSNSDDEDAGNTNSKSQLECNGRLRLQTPKKWEDEYLHQTPKNFSFPVSQRLFSMESVNKRLLEHGLLMNDTKTTKKEHTGYTYLKHDNSLEEGKHRIAVDDGEIEGAFGMLNTEKQENKCSRLMQRQKQKKKRRPKVITGRSRLCMNSGSGSTRIKITLRGTVCNVQQEHTCKNKLDQNGMPSDESPPVELCYGE